MGFNQVKEGILSKLREWKNSPLQFVVECIGATPSKQQAHALKILPKTKRLTIRSGHGCFALGTAVTMYPFGFKMVQDVEVGDTVMGDDGTPREVLELFSGEEEMYRIQYHNSTYYDVNASHSLVLAAARHYKGYKVGDIREVPVEEYLNWTHKEKTSFIGLKKGVEYEEREVAIPPYILGVWLGDGDHNAPRFVNEDVEVIGVMQLFAEANGLRLSAAADEKTYGIVGLKGNKENLFLELLRGYDLIGNKHIPKEYLFNSRENRLRLLAGLLDTDGNLNRDAGFEITQKREDLAEDILFLAQSCGLHASLNEKTVHYRGEDRIYYRVHISRNITDIPTQIKRKQASFSLYRQRNNLHFGFSVTPLGKDDYYGFELDGNHRFLLSDFTVVRNTGKDAFAAWAAIWFSTTRTYPKVPCVAPTAHQLQDVLWSELSKWLRQSKVADEFVIQKDKIFHKEAPKEWWMRALSPSVKATKEEQAETLAGLHAIHMLIIGDEVSGISDPTFVPLEGAMTQPDNMVILIGNMTKNTGYFYNTHFHPTMSQKWTKLHWDSRKSELVTKDMIDYFIDNYGEDSNVFRIRVAGDPPIDDESTFIPLSWAIQCIGNTIEVDPDWPLYLSVDVARYGDDDSVILPRRGMKISRWETFHGLHTLNLSHHVVRSAVDMEAKGVAIDEIGIGGGVVDWLQHDPRGLGIDKAIGINVADASSDKRKWYRLRDELWDRVRKNCMKGLYDFPDETVKMFGRDMNLGNILADELASVKYSLDNNVLKIESKRDMKARGVKSPNIADALCMSEYFNNIAYALWSDKQKKQVEKRKSVQPMPSPAPSSGKRSQLWQAV